MILLSEYVDVIKATYNIKTKGQLKEAIFKNMALLYPGIQNMINRSAKFYGSSMTKKVEDENIRILFDCLGIEKKNNSLEKFMLDCDASLRNQNGVGGLNAGGGAGNGGLGDIRGGAVAGGFDGGNGNQNQNAIFGR